MNNPKNQNNISRYVKLEDYKVFDYEIPEIFLDFVIQKNAVNVTTKLKLVKKNKNTRNLILDGTDIFCLLYTSPSPRDLDLSRMPSSA